ncbi:hypothetical protein TrRE_jg8222, partial [Triparma retinervis]
MEKCATTSCVKRIKAYLELRGVRVLILNTDPSESNCDAFVAALFEDDGAPRYFRKRYRSASLEGTNYLQYPITIETHETNPNNLSPTGGYYGGDDGEDDDKDGETGGSLEAITSKEAKSESQRLAQKYWCKVLGIEATETRTAPSERQRMREEKRAGELGIDVTGLRRMQGEKLAGELGIEATETETVVSVLTRKRQEKLAGKRGIKATETETVVSVLKRMQD